MVRNTLAHNNTLDKGEIAPPLSSGAYFPASTKPRWKDGITTSRLDWRTQKDNATPAQTRRNPHPKPYKVQIYADLLKVKHTVQDAGLTELKSMNGGGGLRDTVQGFSRASRKRLIEFMAKVRNTESMMFLTMTYDDAAWIAKTDDHQRDIEAFRKRFERQFPTWKALWRVELKERKSGDLIGQVVPHFHMLIWTDKIRSENSMDALSNSFLGWGAIAWQEITNSHDDNHLQYGFHCTPVRNRKHAYKYVSKYIAKEDMDNYEIGRRWGRIGKFDCTVGEEFRLDRDEYVQFRRLVKKWLNNKNKSFAKKFARQSPEKGCAVFGLGDTSCEVNYELLFPPYLQMLHAAQVHAAGKRAIERSFGD